MEQAKDQYQRGSRRFYIGGGMGADMWAGEALLALKVDPGYPGVEIVCIMPNENHCIDWDDYSTARLERILSACDEKQIAGKSLFREAHRNRYFHMVDQSQAVIAVCQGSRDRRSVAEAAFGYAKKRKKVLVIIDPMTAGLSVLNREY